MNLTAAQRYDHGSTRGWMIGTPDEAARVWVADPGAPLPERAVEVDARRMSIEEFRSFVADCQTLLNHYDEGTPAT